jgi:diguanylate cyclase (GGDEF)-like protein
MYDLLFTIQYISIIGLFIEGCIVFRSKKDALHAYLFLSCVATLVNNIGYLFQMRAGTEEAYITALQLSYAGRVWIAFSLFMFAMELSRIRIPNLIVNILVPVHAAIYAVILTLKHHKLYYTDMHFDADGILPSFSHGNGPVHHFFIIMQVCFIIIGCFNINFAYAREKRKTARKRLVTVVIAFLVETMFFIIQIIRPNGIYDLTMIGYTLGTLFMLLAIFRYSLLGVRDIAQEYLVDKLSEGIIAVDSEGEVQYYNEPAMHLYPELAYDPDKVVEAVTSAILHAEPISIKDRMYSPEENDLLYNGESLGRLYVLVDSTDHYNRLNEEKSMLKKELLTDPVTGFYNRKGMEQYSEKIYTRAQQEDKYLFVCVADMNGLKPINDNYGHEHGDEALRELSRMIRDVLTYDDMAFRTGGDEFLIIGTREEADKAITEFCERMEKTIREHNDRLSLPYRIDMSYGPLIKKVQGYDEELADMIKESDGMMYEMKKKRDPYKR